MVQARQLLPSTVDPIKFPLSPGVLQSLELDGIVARITQAQIQGETVVVTFTYRWNEPQLGPGPDSDDCPLDRHHWWRFEARRGGEVVLVEEGGAVLLPGGTEDKVR